MNGVVKKISGKENVTCPKLAILISRSAGIPMEEALIKANEAAVVIASNKRLSKALNESNEWRNIRTVFTCWSGTMTGYDIPNKKLGKNIEYIDPEIGVRYIFPVPERHQGKKNVILVVNHPNFTLETDKKTRIIQANNVGVVSKFPVDSHKWYLGDPKYDIPTGKEVGEDNIHARYLIRREKRVGLISRGWDSGYGDINRQNINIENDLSWNFGVAVEPLTLIAKK